MVPEGVSEDGTSLGGLGGVWAVWVGCLGGGLGQVRGCSVRLWDGFGAVLRGFDNAYNEEVTQSSGRTL